MPLTIHIASNETKQTTASQDPVKADEKTSSAKIFSVTTNEMKPLQPPSPVIPVVLKDEKIIPKQEIALYSFDFDGCILNNNYRQGDGEIAVRIVRSNVHLFNVIADQIKQRKFLDVTIMSASLRQSYEIEMKNSRADYFASGVKSFPHFKHVCGSISLLSGMDCCLDMTLMQDLCNDKKAGDCHASYDAANRDPSIKWIGDDTKVTIIYAQAHKIASENPAAIITYNVYDDRTDILTKIKEFYAAYPHILPHNIVLNLHHYDGSTLTTIWKEKYSDKLVENNSVKGSGLIDFNYRKTLKSIHNFDGNPNQLYSKLEMLADWIQKNQMKDKVTDNTFSKEHGKYRDCARFVSASLFAQSYSYQLKSNNDVMEEYNIKKMKMELNDKLKTFAQQEIERLKKEIPNARKIDSSFFNCCVAISEEEKINSVIRDLDHFNSTIDYYTDFDCLYESQKKIMMRFSKELTPILLPYLEVYPWINESVDKKQLSRPERSSV